MRRRHLLQTIGLTSVSATAGCLAQSPSESPAFVSSSPALENGGTIPQRFTCDGAGVSPPFSVTETPEPTAALALVAEWDRGALTEPRFWTIWNIPPQTEQIPAGIPRTETVTSLGGARQGKQPTKRVGYDPPCPPVGQPYEHRFQIYALDRMLDVTGGAENEDAAEAIDDAEIASRRITVTYTRSTAEP